MRFFQAIRFLILLALLLAALAGCQGQKLDQDTKDAIKEIQDSINAKKSKTPEADDGDASKKYESDEDHEETLTCEQARGSLEKENADLRKSLENYEFIVTDYENRIRNLSQALDRVLITKTAQDAFKALVPPDEE